MMAKRKTIEQRLAEEKARYELELTRVKRKAIKALSTYEAAERSRLTSDWRARTLTADEAIINDAETLNARARQFQRDVWSVASAIGAYCRHVVGTGITCRSAAHDPVTGDQHEEFNRQIDKWWRRWIERKEFCDIERRKTFIEMQRLAVSDYVTVGESFFILSYLPRPNTVGLVVQMAESEQLDLSITHNADTGNEIRGGIEIDVYGAPVAYWFQSTNTSQRYGSSVRIPANRVLHFDRQSRVRQTRGVSLLAPVMQKQRHLGMYDNYALVAARLEACIGGVITQDSAINDVGSLGLPPDLVGGSNKDSRGADKLIMEPGMLPRLNPGEDVRFNTPQKPGGQYEPFTKAQIAQIAAGLGLDYSQILRDYSQGNFSSQRQALLDIWKETDSLQTLLITDVCMPIREAFKRYAILEGKVNAPGFFENVETEMTYLADEWRGPRKDWIDPLKQANAAAKLIDYNLETHGSILNEMGRDVRDVFQARADEKELAEQLGLDFPAWSRTKHTETRDDDEREEKE